MLRIECIDLFVLFLLTIYKVNKDEVCMSIYYVHI